MSVCVSTGVIGELRAYRTAHEAMHSSSPPAPSALRGHTKPSDSAPPVPPENEALTTVLLVMASSNRPEYLRRSLQFVGKYHPR